MRKSYGFRTFRVLELALYHSLGKLPEPEIHPRFLLTNPFLSVLDALVTSSDGALGEDGWEA